jgi:molybdopterin converting factor small subunit
MRVVIPSPLLSYTGKRDVEADGATLDAVLADLDRRHPGLRFRLVDEQGGLRPHMRLFVNGQAVRDLSTPLAPADEVRIVQALSGG